MPFGLGTIGAVLGVGGAIVGGAAVIPIALGFGTAGIVAGSVAAGVQAGIGSVAAGSAFATLTSLGMTGTLAATAAGGAITSAIGAVVALIP